MTADLPLTGRSVTYNAQTVERDDASSVRARVRSHRDRLPAQGLRPIQIWVPDVRSAAFAAEAHSQSTAVARSSYATDDQAFIDAVGLDDA